MRTRTVPSLRLCVLALGALGLSACPAPPETSPGDNTAPGVAPTGEPGAAPASEVPRSEVTGPAADSPQAHPHAVVHFGVTCVTYEDASSDRTVVVSEAHGAALASVDVTCTLANDERPAPVVESVRLPVGEMELSLSEASVENVGAHVLNVSGETWLTINYRRLDTTNTTFTVETAFANPWGEAP